MVAMHEWFCGRAENADLYLCDAWRDFRAGASDEEMARKHRRPSGDLARVS